MGGLGMSDQNKSKKKLPSRIIFGGMNTGLDTVEQSRHNKPSTPGNKKDRFYFCHSVLCQLFAAISLGGIIILFGWFEPIIVGIITSVIAGIILVKLKNYYK